MHTPPSSQSSEPVIEVNNIGKKYNINHQRGGYVSLREVLMNVVKAPLSFLKNKVSETISSSKEEFWALKNVSFSIQKGEVVGIIGSNGAGKSTLLKILSQITPPTEGEIILRGKVGSLLEVGTGFHPELTGRENIFLNGAILGMTKKEIQKKFDEIVAFAGIGKFLDTPVKHYSSGMYVRLAFSVAAHMEPDILLVDEVLAVGDTEFQKKCLGKMEEVTKEKGRTILFVSHNLGAVQALCKKTILLEHGNVKMVGDTSEVIKQYTARLQNTSIAAPVTAGIATVLVQTEEKAGAKKSSFFVGEPVRFSIDIKTERPLTNAALGLGLVDMNGARVLTFHTAFQHKENWSIGESIHIDLDWPECILGPGVYSFEMALYENGNQMVSVWHQVGQIDIIEANYFGTGKLPDPNTQGKIVTKATWHIPHVPKKR